MPACLRNCESHLLRGSKKNCRVDGQLRAPHRPALFITALRPVSGVGYAIVAGEATGRTSSSPIGFVADTVRAPG